MSVMAKIVFQEYNDAIIRFSKSLNSKTQLHITPEFDNPMARIAFFLDLIPSKGSML